MEYNAISDDCLNTLKEIKDESVDCIVTSLIFNPDFKKWEDILPSSETLKECLRVMKGCAVGFFICESRQDFLSRVVIELDDIGFNVEFGSFYWKHPSKENNNLPENFIGDSFNAPEIETIIVVMKPFITEEERKKKREELGILQHAIPQIEAEESESVLYHFDLTALLVRDFDEKQKKEYPYINIDSKKDLVKCLISMVSCEKNLVLDPYCDSEITLEASVELKRWFIGCKSGEQIKEERQTNNEVKKEVKKVEIQNMKDKSVTTLDEWL